MPVILISLLSILIFFSIIADYKYNKIFNYITFGGIFGGLIANVYLYGFNGLNFSLMGLFLGMSIFFPLFYFNLLGAGDVKLIAAVGALFGPRMVFSASVYTIISGAIMSILILTYKKKLFGVLKSSLWALYTLIHPKFKFELPAVNSCMKVPFALAIAVGSLMALSFDFFSVFVSL